MKKFSKSRQILIVPYKNEWPKEFNQIAEQLKQTLGTRAVRIDHIGSTSVPDLAAKDVIDIQITVAYLRDESIVHSLKDAGYQHLSQIVSDNYLGKQFPENPQLEKRLVQEKEGDRKANIHIRQLGFKNQEFPLLFRDYLRAVPAVCAGYQLLKLRLAEVYSESMEGYLYFKEPAMGLIYEGALQWAKSVNWTGHKQIIT